MQKPMYQVATLQALMLGYTKSVVTAKELVRHGDTGLGTFTGVDGEMIVLDGHVYRADNKGSVTQVPDDAGIPFAAVADLSEPTEWAIDNVDSIDRLKEILNNAIEEDFGLNSMYVVRLDGNFTTVKARSEAGRYTQHVALSEILAGNQKDFVFENTTGSVVCMYFPDYMDGINAAGWHLHYASDSRTQGGHVFDLSIDHVQARRTRVSQLQIQLPTDAAFDTYSLKQVSNSEVKAVEQAKK